MELQRIVSILLRRWWLVLGMPALVLGVSLILLSNSPYVASIRVSVLIPGDTQETGTAERPELMVLDDIPELVGGSVFADAVTLQLQTASPQFSLSPSEVQASLSADYFSRIVTIRATRPDEQEALALVEAVSAIFEREVNFFLIPEGGDAATVRLIEPSSVSRDSPTTGAVALIVQTLVALVIGFGLAALAAAFDQRVHTRSDALAAVPVPVLGELRPSHADGAVRQRRANRSPPDASGSSATPPDEAIRALRATMRSALLAQSPPGEPCDDRRDAAPVWLIVPIDQDLPVASRVGDRLGAAGAAAGQRCLVIDATHADDTVVPPPLTAWLVGETDDIPPVPSAPAAGSAAVVSLGPAPEGRDLMRGPRWARALAVARTTYDDILIAVRPMTVSADAMTLAPHVDAILLLVTVGRTNGSALVQARAALQAAGGSVAGTVLVTAE